MRQERRIELNDAREVVVRELTHRHVVALIQGMPEDLADRPLRSLLTDDLAQVVGLLGDCIEVQGGDWRDLGFSAITSIWETFRELNAPFFELMRAAMPWMEPEWSSLSTLFAPPSSNEGTPEPGTMAGAT